jgi:hypothetical protein
MKPITRQDIFRLIDSERERQDKKHPKLPVFTLHPYEPMESQRMIQRALNFFRTANEFRERTTSESWFGVIAEEVLEVFEAGDKDSMKEEIIQAAALLVKMYESIVSEK